MKKKNKQGSWIREKENSKEIKKICHFGGGINGFGLCQMKRVMVMVQICQRKANDCLETVFPNISKHLRALASTGDVGVVESTASLEVDGPLLGSLEVVHWIAKLAHGVFQLWKPVFSGRAVECHPSKSMPLNLVLVQSSGFRDAHSVLVFLWLMVGSQRDGESLHAQQGSNED